MNTTELVKEIAEREGLTQASVSNALKSAVAIIRDELAAGEAVRIADFGTFTSQHKAERHDRQVPGRNLIHASVSFSTTESHTVSRMTLSTDVHGLRLMTERFRSAGSETALIVVQARTDVRSWRIRFSSLPEQFRKLMP